MPYKTCLYLFLRTLYLDLLFKFFGTVFKLAHCIAFLYLSLSTLDSQSIRGNVTGNCRTCRSISALSYSYRRYKICIAADKRIILYNCPELLIAVIVYRYDAAAEVYVCAYVGITDIGKMRYSGIFSDSGIFDFNKISDLRTFLNMRIRSELNVRTDFNIVLNN